MSRVLNLTVDIEGGVQTRSEYVLRVNGWDVVRRECGYGNTLEDAEEWAAEQLSALLKKSQT